MLLLRKLVATIAKKLLADSTLSNNNEIVNQKYITCWNYGEQTHADPMGSPLSPFMANLFIEELKKKAS